jgi:hypothetical protein
MNKEITMHIETHELDEGRTLVIKVTGKLTAEDYKTLVPEFDRLINKHGKLRILFEMHDFHGWEPRALWEDLKVDARHFDHIERLAMIGEQRWQKWMASFCKPFTTAEIRYFPHDDAEAAREWLAGEPARMERAS